MPIASPVAPGGTSTAENNALESRRLCSRIWIQAASDVRWLVRWTKQARGRFRTATYVCHFMVFSSTISWNFSIECLDVEGAEGEGAGRYRQWLLSIQDQFVAASNDFHSRAESLGLSRAILESCDVQSYGAMSHDMVENPCPNCYNVLCSQHLLIEFPVLERYGDIKYWHKKIHFSFHNSNSNLYKSKSSVVNAITKAISTAADEHEATFGYRMSVEAGDLGSLSPNYFQRSSICRSKIVWCTKSATGFVRSHLTFLPRSLSFFVVVDISWSDTQSSCAHHHDHGFALHLRQLKLKTFTPEKPSRQLSTRTESSLSTSSTTPLVS
jgi:hypothetical protein